MKKTTKVILLSLLIFPGAGHLALKRYAVAIGFITSFIYLLSGFINDLHDLSLKTIEMINNGEIPLDALAISQALTEQGILNNNHLSTIGYLLITLWLASAFDSYRIAKQVEKNSELDQA